MDLFSPFIFVLWILLGLSALVLVTAYIDPIKSINWRLFYNPQVDMPECVFFNVMSISGKYPKTIKASSVFPHQTKGRIVYAEIVCHDRDFGERVKDLLERGYSVEIYRLGTGIFTHCYLPDRDPGYNLDGSFCPKRAFLSERERQQARGS